ncbi:RNA polymerase sigma factor [Paraburkholderia kururiensis]|uniref:RNA polymerase sigma factor n=1 Tax=Paraburkholderia kururiensis TaxID=984307 RepID=A0ABZ0WPJ3_9BURK|nr:RNA polymerase sigma factor [Paraburkholderia kururiensis]WQD79299.1 RNA polymerase sigma factor [Paraburkholderia kururiensis]
MRPETNVLPAGTFRPHADASCTANAAFERAWRSVHGHLEQRARSLAKGDRVAADDLVANTALKALVYMRRMPDRIRNPEGFLFTVLNHVFLDSVRHASREGRVLYYCDESDADYLGAAAATAISPAHIVELGEGLALIAEAIERLTPAQRQLFSLKFEHELSYAAIADELNINEALARKRVELLRRKLRAAVEKRDTRPRPHSRMRG